MFVEIQRFEIGAYNSDARASLKQMTDIKDYESHVTAIYPAVVALFCLILFGTVWCCLVLFGTVWCCLVLFGAVSKNAARLHTSRICRYDILLGFCNGNALAVHKE
jgi:hypothetical protein